MPSFCLSLLLFCFSIRGFSCLVQIYTIKASKCPYVANCLLSGEAFGRVALSALFYTYFQRFLADVFVREASVWGSKYKLQIFGWGWVGSAPRVVVVAVEAAGTLVFRRLALESNAQ